MKNNVFGAKSYAPAVICSFLARYATDPEAKELTVIKNDVFGAKSYAPAFSWCSCALYAVEPDACE